MIPHVGGFPFGSRGPLLFNAQASPSYVFVFLAPGSLRKLTRAAKRVKGRESFSRLFAPPPQATNRPKIWKISLILPIFPSFYYKNLGETCANKYLGGGGGALPLLTH